MTAENLLKPEPVTGGGRRHGSPSHEEGGIGGAAICDRLPPVATTGLDRGSIFVVRVGDSARDRACDLPPALLPFSEPSVTAVCGVDQALQRVRDYRGRRR